MNEVNLQQLINHIENHKSDFNQGDTDNCIVGTAARLGGYSGIMMSRIKSTAGEFLNIDRAQIETFYDVDKWPDEYKDRFNSVSHREEVEVALDYLRSLLTGSEDLTHILGSGLSYVENASGEDVLVLKRGKATVSIPLNLAQIRKLHLLFGKIVWENS